MAPSTTPARGMRDFLPEDVRRRRYVIDIIAEVYQRYGFEPLETPAVENIETLMGKYGEEGDRLIFRILKRGEEGRSGEADLALRYDLTVPLARVVAEYKAKLPKFFKRYQVQPVWRADRPQRGRFREFFQCDVDAIGSTSPVVEVELLAAAADILTRLGFGAFAIKLNHRKVLRALLEVGGVAVERHGDALVILDKLDKIGHDAVVSELATRASLTSAAAAAVVSLFTRAENSSNEHTLARLRAALERHEQGLRACDDLTQMVALAAATSAGSHLVVDPSLARGLSYYTGAIFEITVSDLAGSLGGGGRYDELVGMFLNQPVPACGISLGLERILVVMGERKMFPEGIAASPADVMVTMWNANSAASALRLSTDLRASGVRTELYPDADKIGKQFKYADARGIRFVTVEGDEEVAAGTIKVKDLMSGEQRVVGREAVVASLTERMAGTASWPNN